jgi:uncharacterized membrane protein SpoIIM required for sporulation
MHSGQPLLDMFNRFEAPMVNDDDNLGRKLLPDALIYTIGVVILGGLLSYVFWGFVSAGNLQRITPSWLTSTRLLSWLAFILAGFAIGLIAARLRVGLLVAIVITVLGFFIGVTVQQLLSRCWRRLKASPVAQQ